MATFSQAARAEPRNQPQTFAPNEPASFGGEALSVRGRGVAADCSGAREFGQSEHYAPRPCAAVLR